MINRKNNKIYIIKKNSNKKLMKIFNISKCTFYNIKNNIGQNTNIIIPIPNKNRLFRKLIYILLILYKNKKY